MKVHLGVLLLRRQASSLWGLPSPPPLLKRTVISNKRTTTRIASCFYSHPVSTKKTQCFSSTRPSILPPRGRQQGHALFSFLTQHDDLDACWNADSWSVNPHGDSLIDDILQGLHSPAPQGLFVIERALRLAQGQNIETVLAKCQYLVKDDYCLSFNTHASLLLHRPGIDWSLLRNDETIPEGWRIVPDNNTTLSASQVASQVLEIVVEASEMQQPVDEKEFQRLLNELSIRLELTLGTDIRGRTAADTAFTLCLAGVTDERLYEQLTYISKLEMNRVKNRSSRRARDVLHVVEKLAAAGLRGPMVESVYDLAKNSTALSEAKYHNLRTNITDSKRFNLLSMRPLLWLWRFSTRQTKAKVKHEDEQEQSMASPEGLLPEPKSPWLRRFDDPTKPLVVDIGCGLGVSIIGLASLRNRYPQEMGSMDLLVSGLDWNQCNYLGGDLSLLGTRFGQGIATRWNLKGHLHFTRASAEDLVKEVDRLYPGRIAMIMIQFPSPYRLKESGNTQLPSTAETGFMVSHSLMKQVSSIVSKSDGRVLLQSNCEDVAVTMRDMGKAVGLSPVVARDPVLSVNDMPPHQRTPQRTQEWIRLGGQRALGPEWSRVPLLPTGCGTETEASCAVHETPVHRCILEPGPRA